MNQGIQDIQKSHSDAIVMGNIEEHKYCYRYPHAAITADCVIFGFNGKSLKILLIERGNQPYFGYWALPGGFMHINESIEECAERELKEETNLSNVFLDQFRVYSRPDRDPRERVVTVAFIALVKPDDYNVIAGDDAAKAMWFDESMLPPLAFDHKDIIREAREYLKEILRLKPVAFELLNKLFTISELQSVYEVINQTSYDRRNFLRTAIDSDVISEVDVAKENTSGRSIKLYTVNSNVTESTRQEANRDYNTLPSPPMMSATFNEDLDESASSCDENTENIFSDYKHTFKSKKAPTKGLFDFLRR